MTPLRFKISKIFERVTATVYDYKYTALLLMLLLTTVLATQMSRLTIDTRDESLFHKDDPALITYNNFRDTFGQDDIFIIALKPKNGLDRHIMKILYRLHDDLKQTIPYLDEIKSLVNGRIVMSRGDTLHVQDLMPIPPKNKEQFEQLMALTGRYPMFKNLLIAPDHSLLCILIRAQAIKPTTDQDLLAGFDGPEKEREKNNPRQYLSNDENVEIASAIRSVLATYQHEPVDFYFAGTPAFVAEIQLAIIKDLGLMIPLSLILIILFLFLLFRRITGVIYPIIVVVFSLMSSMGIMAAAKIPITNVIQILPCFLIVVGVADSVHILAIFYRNYAVTKDKRSAIITAVGYAGLPILMTSITTGFGLFSFVWADLAPIAQLGYVAPIGVMLAMLYTIILLPALIAIFPVKSIGQVSIAKGPFLEILFYSIARITTQYPKRVMFISFLIMLISGYGAWKVRISHNALTWFPKDAWVRVSSELLDQTNGGTVMLEVLLDTKAANGLYDPALLANLDRAATEIPKISVGGIKAAKAWSIADVVKETNRALHEDNDLAYVLPNTREMVAQELLLFETGGSDDLEDVCDGSFQTARLSILAPFTDAVKYKEYVLQIEILLKTFFPDTTLSFTGHMSLFIKITKNFITSMAKSYVIALVIITLFMVALIGKLKIGLMSMVANVVPILCVFGIMGFSDIPLDMSTILIGSLVLGLVVDDTIHFLHHFRGAYEKTKDVREAVYITLSTTGRALLITSCVLCGGFFIYTTSQMAYNFRFGLLAGCAVLFALVADFFLIPALLKVAYSKDA